MQENGNRFAKAHNESSGGGGSTRTNTGLASRSTGDALYTSTKQSTTRSVYPTTLLEHLHKHIQNFARTSYLLRRLGPSAPPFFRRLAASKTEQASKNKQKRNGEFAIASVMRVLRRADLNSARVCAVAVGGGLARASQLPRRPMGARRGHVTLPAPAHACLQIIIIRPVWRRRPARAPLHRSS